MAKKRKYASAATYIGGLAAMTAGWTAAITTAFKGRNIEKKRRGPAQKITTLKQGGAVPSYYDKGGKLN
tara:strand:+ start:972 stop:1178 length:207 start_codon:yes stop_codon:yes gene_type:complete